MDELLFVDSTFEKDNTSRYILSIQLSLDGFSFSILNLENKCLALFQSKKLVSQPENSSIDILKEKIRNCEYLNLSYKTISVIWLSKKSCLIPSSLFSETIAVDSFQLCQPLLKDEIIRWNEVKEMNAYLVYALPSALPEFLNSQFSEAKISHQSFGFYRQALNQTIDSKHPKIYIQVFEHFFDAFIPDVEQKHFANSFAFKDEVDMVYFILNIYKQQKLNTEYSQLHLSGKIDETSKAYETLQRYIKFIKLETIENISPLKNDVSNSEYNQFTKLINTSLCE
ncbi:DUF3822 family protein [Ancylomarina sp. DW003]|nr:DUF3822 family protein [Ancylomarina sp. DW003]MDE5422731.1 DUF3822 family protein [Ancylomarina sp. DW003]